MISGLSGYDAVARPIVDFATAATAALQDLHNRVGLDVWHVARRDGDSYVVLAALGDSADALAIAAPRWDETLCARMIDGSAPMVAHDVDLVAPYAMDRALAGMQAKSYLAVPIVAPDGEVLGALSAIGFATRSADFAALLPTVQVQADLLAMLLSHELRIAEETRLVERADRAAHHIDALTGVANREAWDTALALEEARAARYASSAAAIVLDVEMLRELNETSGHAAGDELLQRTATILGDNIRRADLVARLGGGGFGVLVPLTDAAGALALAEHLRSVLAAGGVSASIGVGARQNGTGLTRAWEVADAAMHADKLLRASGRTAEAPTVGRSAATAADVAPYAGVQTQAGPQPSTVAPTVDADAELADFASSSGTGSVDALLRLARDQLGMDVAFLSVFEGDNRRIRNGQSNIDLPLAPGFVQPADQTHCRLICDGQVAEVSPDAMKVPLFAALPVTAALGIRAFVGVPIHRRNGDLYGTLCVFSQRADDTLQARDAGVLRALGEIAMDLVEVEDRHDGIRHAFIARLDKVYANGGPQPVYQPVMSLDTLDVVGYEALSRFPGSDRNPADWFASATEAGFGTELELRALANAVTALPEINGYLAVNVSPATVSSPGFTRLLAPLPLDRVVLELTEHDQVRDYRTVTKALQPLRQQGLRVAVDDAGAGFASMAHILAILPDLIKLDISLVHGIDGDLARQALAAALSAFADKTGAGVIAEGVETSAELACLRHLGIEFGQGYFLGRPELLPVRVAALA